MFKMSDKKRIIISTVTLLIGLVLVRISSIPALNPTTNNEQGTLGTYLLILIAIPAVILGSIVLVASLVLSLLNKKFSSVQAKRITFLVVSIIVLTLFYVIVGKESITKFRYQAEIRSRHANYVAYQNPPDVRSITKTSKAITTQANDGIVSSVTVNLHDCSPGLAKVTSTKSTTYFVFSGVQGESSFGLNECVFYIGREKPHQSWDGLLHAKCEAYLGNDPEYNTVLLPVIDGEVNLKGNNNTIFLSNCRDLRTGIAPNFE